MDDNFVGDDELLYRRIPAGRKLYKYRIDGTIEISSQAFSDRQFRVSVDRAALWGNNPRHTLGNVPGGVVGLVCREVRGLDDLARNDQRGEIIQRFSIDVEPAPLPDNLAHAEIYAIPPFTDADKKGAFHRLCRRLARLAEAKPWEILPESLKYFSLKICIKNTHASHQSMGVSSRFLFSTGRQLIPLPDLHIPLEQIPRDDEVLDFVCAFVDAGDAEVAVPAFDGHFAGVAHAAVDLHDAVYHAVGHVGAVEFGHAGLVTVVHALVGFPGGVQGEPLGGLAVRDGLAEGDALLGVFNGHFQQAFRRADAARGNEPAALADPLHAEREALADFAQHVVFGDAHVLEEEFGGRPAAHGVDGARGPAHGAVDQEAGDPSVLRRLCAVGDGEDHGEIGLIAVGDKYLLPVDDPGVAIFDGAGANGRGVGTRARLGEREARAALALDGRDQVLLLLLLVAQVEDVVRAPAEAEGDKRAPHFHGDEGRHDRAEVRAAILLWRVDTPEAHLFRLLLQRAIPARLDAGGVFAFVVHHLFFQRHKLTIYKAAYRLLNHFLFVGKGKIHSGLLLCLKSYLLACLLTATLPTMAVILLYHMDDSSSFPAWRIRLPDWLLELLPLPDRVIIIRHPYWIFRQNMLKEKSV